MPNNYKGKGKPRKGNQKDRFRKDPEKSVDVKFGCNDITWYKMSDQLLKDVARLPFGRPLGLEQPVGATDVRPHNSGNPTITASTNTPVVPGICVFNYANSAGASYGSASPLNVAARAVYSYIRHANSGHTNYESPDLMCYLDGVGELYTAIAFLEKVYGAAQYWSQTNRYFGDTFIRALGFDPDNVRDNLSDLRAGINLLVVKINALAAPKVFSMYERRFFLASTVLKDQDIAKAQLYTFRPYYIRVFSGTHASTGSCLVPIDVPWKAGTCTVSTALDFINSIIDEYMAEEDIGIMNGDIMKAFGNGERGGLHLLATIPDNAIINPVYSEEMMLQIHNLKYTGFTPYAFNSVAAMKAAAQITPTAANLLTAYAGLIAQVGGSLYETVGFREGVRFTVYAHNQTSHTDNAIYGVEKVVTGAFIDAFHDDVTPDDVMIATRLQPQIDVSSTFVFKTLNWFKCIVGADYIINAEVWTGSENSVVDVVSNNASIEFDLRDSTYSGDTYTLRISSYNDVRTNRDGNLALLKFHRAPFSFYYMVKGDQTASAIRDLYVIGPLQYLSDIEMQYSEPNLTATLGNLHLSAILSMFRIPELGMFSV